MESGPTTEFLVITGPTASGKERTALGVAERLGGEIISLDSMKVYRGMDIGTAKATAECRRKVPHHLLDVADPRETFSAARWARLAEAALGDIAARGRVPIISGGTILYLKALLYGLFDGPSADPAIRDRLASEADRDGPAALHRRLAEVDPAAAERIHPNDLRRVVRALEVHELTGRPISALQRQFNAMRPHLAPRIVALRRTRDDLRRRIDLRVQRMIDAGLETEVRRLLDAEHGLSREAAQAVGYREMIAMLEGRVSPADLVALIQKNTAVFARRQMTHLRSLEGRQWIDVAPHESPEQTAERAGDLWRSR